LRQRIDLALHLTAHRIELLSLIVDTTCSDCVVDRAGNQPTELKTGREDRTNSEQETGGSDQERAGLLEIEAEHLPGSTVDNLKIHFGAYPLSGRRSMRSRLKANVGATSQFETAQNARWAQTGTAADRSVGGSQEVDPPSREAQTMPDSGARWQK